MSQWVLVCAWCKVWARKHNEKMWKPIESAEFQIITPELTSHGICPICSAVFFQNEDLDQLLEDIESINRK